jgi:hypothetical protein
MKLFENITMRTILSLLGIPIIVIASFSVLIAPVQAKGISDLQVTIEPDITKDCSNYSLEAKSPVEYSCIVRDIPITHAHIYISSSFPTDIQTGAFWLEFGHFLGDDAPMEEIQKDFPASVLNQAYDFGKITSSTMALEGMSGMFPLVLMGQGTQSETRFFLERMQELK